MRLVTQISLDIEVVIEDGLEPSTHIPVHLVKAAAVIDLELLIPLGSVPSFPVYLPRGPPMPVETPDTLVAAIRTMPLRKRSLSREETVIPAKGRKIR